MGCVKSKKTIKSDTHPSSQSLNAKPQGVPDEEAVEVAPPKALQSPQKERTVEVDAKQSSPAAPPEVHAEDSAPTVKPSFPNLEPKFDFQFLEEEQAAAGPANDQAKNQASDLNQLVEDLDCN